MAPKAAAGTENEDVKFLLTIIKQLDGTINWQTVSDELNLPSKGAAAKRYSRLPGKYDIASPAKKVAKVSSISPDAEDNEESPKKTKGKPKAKKAATPAKKRKVAEVDEDDDDEAVKSEVEDDD